MNDKQALKKARKLLGPRAIIKRKPARVVIQPHQLERCLIGTLSPFMAHFFAGGETWEEAFADAEARGMIK